MNNFIPSFPAGHGSARALHRVAATAAMAVLIALLTVLQACGGAAGDATEQGAQARLPELAGRVSNGATATNVGALQITVKGRTGTARTAEGRLAPVDGSDYLASLDQLSGPYLLSDSARSPSTLSLYSVATGPGVANLTPLTTLLVAQLLAAEPGAYFEALGSRGGFTAADETSVAAAEQRVRRYLQREFGFTVPATVGNFVTTRFDRTAGDPMFDTLQALVSRIGSAGDYGAVVSAVAQEAARCKVEQVRQTAGAVVDELCPFAKSNEADPADASVRVLRFTNRHGDVLTLRWRGSEVLDVQRTTAEGASSACSGAACTGVSLAAPAADQTRTVTFVATPLGGAGGSVVLDGSLRSSVPGIALPGLACTTNRFYLIQVAAGTATGYCTTPDDFGLGASGQSLASGATRRSYTFSDGAGGPTLEVITQGSTVVRALVSTVDPVTGGAVAAYQCRGAGCQGITLAAVTVDTSLGVPVVLQPIRFDRTVLAAVLPDGTLSATDSVTVEASFTGVYVDDPGALPLLPVACDAAAPTIQALPSDQSLPIPVCEPADTQGFQLRSTTLDGDGNTVYSTAGLLTDGAGSFAAGSAVTVTVSPAGAVLAVVFDQFAGPRYRCTGTACTGVVIAAANALGERSLSLSATLLQEVGTAGLLADRTVTLNGSTVAPPALSR